MSLRLLIGRRWGAIALCAALGGLFVAVGGCDSKSSGGPRRGPAVQAGAQGGLFDSVAENLERLEQYETDEIRRQICDRLNQWYLQEKPTINWQSDPLVRGLNEELRNLVVVRSLDTTQFPPSDAIFLQESVWLRDISKQARADQFSDVDVAERLFDWTVRNIQLDADPQPPARQFRRRPYETLLLGHGTATQRAWVFILLARQQGLDVVLLAPADRPEQAPGPLPGPWLTALESQGELYLFDCSLGLPIAGPRGQGVATLAQAGSDEQLLRRLDLDGEHRYPLAADDLKRVVAYVEAAPPSLSRRMALVESRLAGKHKLALTSPSSALAERLKKIPQVSDAKLWTWPFEVALWQSKLDTESRKAADREMLVFKVIPELFKARSLYFKGACDGDTGAKKYFLEMRPPDASINDYKLPAEYARQVKKEDLSRIEATQIVLMKQAKQDASYWLGLVMFQQRSYPAAIDFFANRTLEDTPGSPWASGARYNLARTYEASGEAAKAISLYQSDTKSPQSHGNQLRARWLNEQGDAADAKADAAATR